MPSVEVVDLNNAVVGSLELSDEVFDAPLNKDLLYEAVRHSQAARRGLGTMFAPTGPPGHSARAYR